MSLQCGNAPSEHNGCLQSNIFQSKLLERIVLGKIWRWEGSFISHGEIPIYFFKKISQPPLHRLKNNLQVVSHFLLPHKVNNIFQLSSTQFSDHLTFL